MGKTSGRSAGGFAAPEDTTREKARALAAQLRRGADELDILAKGIRELLEALH
jgi:deoxyribose-phosphate aldolase